MLRERVRAIAESGFEGFFASRSGSQAPSVAEARRCADEYGLFLQSIHAPFFRVADLWDGGEAGEAALDELLVCLADCARAEVPLMICHAFIGFDRHSPTAVGVENYGRLVRRAGELGIRIALENTEGEEYLAALFHAFSGEGHVGFCWDSGHELCYNRKDMLSLYGDRLFGTHLNDNLGVRGDAITPKDDLHLLPFDGVGDWQAIARRLAGLSFDGPLTFELKPSAELSFAAYAKEAHARAERLLSLVQACAKI
jgi:sugar phosphate isomerase/epimerase